MPVKSQAALTMVPATPPTTKVAGPSDAQATLKEKGKGCALSSPYINEVPAGIPYGYNLSFDNGEFDEDYAAEEQHALTSNTVAHIAVILLGTAPTGNSASSSRGGGRACSTPPQNHG